jgi:hypothetical protein
VTDDLRHFTDTNTVNGIRTRTQALIAKLNSGSTPTTVEVRQMAADLLAVADDSDHWYQQADFFRESYRLTKGLSEDELNAQLAIEEASRPHRRPCRFPNSACVCP